MDDNNIKKIIKEMINEVIGYPLSNMDDYGDIVEVKKGLKEYRNCENNNLISEGSLNRILSFKDRKWAIISAHRKKFDKKQNIQRNRILRGVLNDKGIGVHQLVGHWQECQDTNIDNKDCPKNMVIDVIERSYFVVKPNDIESNDFRKLILSLMMIDREKQDAIIYHEAHSNNIDTLDVNGRILESYKEWTLGKIAQTYSKYVNKMNVPFVFEGMEVPGSNSGAMVMHCLNIKYLII